MTPAIARRLHRVAKLCYESGDWKPLDVFVDAYKASPHQLSSTDAAAGSGSPAVAPNRAAAGCGKEWGARVLSKPDFVAAQKARTEAMRAALDDRPTAQPDTGLRRFLAWLR